ncbi:hypothetical protein EVAR_55755_1 [Eumeta japonica]|uniref:Uncharacterized protein n=1 Tax=Eumeta variegata TaxID=151549 RepID=A0A4C1XER6_EUMVA|nr:hypothetical protein EVAR_55755_1 [Eumeta japonica]
MDDLPDDMGQLLTNVLLFLLAPHSPASFVTVSDAATMSRSEDEMNKKKSSQSPSLNDVPSLPHLTNVDPTEPLPATPLDTTSPPTKSVGCLEYNNNDRGPFVIRCQRIEASPSAGSVLHSVFFGKILQSANVKDTVNGSVKRIGRKCIALSFLNPTACIPL